MKRFLLVLCVLIFCQMGYALDNINVSFDFTNIKKGILMSQVNDPSGKHSGDAHCPDVPSPDPILFKDFVNCSITHSGGKTNLGLMLQHDESKIVTLYFCQSNTLDCHSEISFNNPNGTTSVKIESGTKKEYIWFGKALSSNDYVTWRSSYTASPEPKTESPHTFIVENHSSTPLRIFDWYHGAGSSNCPSVHPCTVESGETFVVSVYEVSNINKIDLTFRVNPLRDVQSWIGAQVTYKCDGNCADVQPQIISDANGVIWEKTTRFMLDPLDSQKILVVGP